MVCGLSEINPICRTLPRTATLDRKQVSLNKALFRKRKLMRHSLCSLIISGKRKRSHLRYDFGLEPLSSFFNWNIVNKSLHICSKRPEEDNITVN